MKRYLFALVFLLITSSAFANTCVTASTGNWRDAIWTDCDPTGYPITGDTVRINAGAVVTNPVGQTNAALSVIIAGYTTNGVGEFINNGTLNLDTNGSLYLAIGDTNKDAKYTNGPGSVVNCGGGTCNLYVGNSYWYSTATKASPAVISGPMAITNTGTGPKQDIQWSNMSFQSTGKNITLNSGTTTGSIASPQITVDSCTFTGIGIATFGSATLTPNTIPISITNSDFVSGGGIVVQRVTGGAATFAFTGNTLYKATASSISFLGSSGLTFTNNVAWNYPITVTATGGHTITGNFLGRDDSLGVYITNLDTQVGNTIASNYMFYPVDNAHFLQSSGAASGSGTQSITDNVFECTVWTTDAGDTLLPGATTLPITYTGNVVLNTASFVDINASDYNTNNASIKNNTTAITDVENAYSGTLFAGENYTESYNPTGLSILDNVVSGNGVAATAVSAHASYATYTATAANYNNFWNCATTYSANFRPNTHANDLAVNPNFVDINRNLAKFNQRLGSGTLSADDGLTYLLGINGYRGTPNFDQNGTISVNGPARLVEWVRYGFSPTHGALRKAGSDGNTIGAMEWQNPRRKRGM